MDLVKKFNWRWLMMLAAVMMMGVSMTACGDDDDDDEDGGDNGMYVGIWADAEDIEDGYNEVFAVKLSADGVGRDGEWNMNEGKFYGEDYTWRWSVDNGMVTIYDEDESRTVPFTISNDGKVGTIDGEVYIKVQ